MNNYFIGLIRTWVPIGVGLVLSYLALHFSIVVDDASKAQLVAALTAVLTAAYYGLVALLEKKLNGKFGWLLGLAGRPQYSKAKDANPTALHAGK